MADAGLFIGWDTPVRGREAKSLDVFNDAVTFQGGLQESGDIESFEIVFLAPHGGDLAGFILVRGSTDQIAALRQREDFQRINTRAGLVVERFGVVDTVLGERIGEQLGIYREAVGEMP
jgi:hypothetical protein